MSDIGDADFGWQVKLGVIGRIITLGIAFAGSLVLAPVLGPTDYGSFYLLMAAVSIADNPLTGWVNACRKRMTEVGWDRSSAIGAVFLAQGTYIAAFVIGSWLIRDLITKQTGDPNSWAHLSVLFAGVVAFKNTIEVLKGTGHFGSVTWFQGLRDLIRVVLQILLVVILDSGVLGMVGGLVMANLLLVLPVMYIVGTLPKLPDLAEFKEIWQYARSSIPNGFVGTTRSRVDILILGILWTQTATGHYEIANKLVLPAMLIAGVASSGMMSRVSNFSSSGDDWRPDLNRNLAYAPIFAIPLFWGALATGEELVVLLYKEAYAPAVNLLIGLSFFMILRTQDSLMSSTIAGLDRPDLNLKINSIALVLNVLVGVGMLYIVGPIGVVIGTIVSQAIAYLIRWSWIDGARPVQELVLKQWASGAGMFVIVILLPKSSPIQIIIAVSVGVLVYFGILYLIAHDFRRQAKSLFPDVQKHLYR